MSPKIHSTFWRDPDVGAMSGYEKLAYLWLITNPSTNALGVCEPSERVFVFETALPNVEPLETLMASRSLVVCGKRVWIRNYIAHQFGRGEKLVRNSIFKSLMSAFHSQPEEIQQAILAEYPEFVTETFVAPEVEVLVPAGPATKKFVKPRGKAPELAEVKDYAKEIELPEEEAEKFCDYFGSNGWKVGGRTPMKDWKAALRNWKRNWSARSGDGQQVFAHRPARLTYSAFEAAKAAKQRLQDEARFITDPVQVLKLKEQIEKQESIISQWNQQQGGGR